MLSIEADIQRSVRGGGVTRDRQTVSDEIDRTNLEKPRILASWSSEHSDPSVTNAAANQPPTATP